MTATDAFYAYQEAQEHTLRMFAEYNFASCGLKLAQIKERAAEVRSQGEPLATVLGKLGIYPGETARWDAARALLCELAEYVACGRGLEEPTP